jgi:hypothetical protein
MYNTRWEAGKSANKLLKYFNARIPALGSVHPAHTDIPGKFLMGDEDWVEGIDRILKMSDTERQNLGVEEERWSLTSSVHNVGPIWESLFLSITGGADAKGL